MQKEGKQKNILNQTKSTSAMWKMYKFFLYNFRSAEGRDSSRRQTTWTPWWPSVLAANMFIYYKKNYYYFFRPKQILPTVFYQNTVGADLMRSSVFFQIKNHKNCTLIDFCLTENHKYSLAVNFFKTQLIINPLDAEWTFLSAKKYFF